MSVTLLTEHHLEFLSLKEGCTGLLKSTLVKIPHCWKSHVTAYFLLKEVNLFLLLTFVFTVTNSAEPDKTLVLQDLNCNGVLFMVR